MKKDLNKTTVYKLQKTGKWVARQILYNIETGKEKSITASHKYQQEAIEQRNENVSVWLSKGEYVDYTTAKNMGIIKKTVKKDIPSKDNTNNTDTIEKHSGDYVDYVAEKKDKNPKKHWSMKLQEMKEKFWANHETLDDEMKDLETNILPYLADKLYKKPDDPDNILIAKALNDLYGTIKGKNWAIHALTGELQSTNQNTKTILDQFDLLYNMIPYNCYVAKCKDIFAFGYKYTVEISDPLTNQVKLRFTTYNKRHCTSKYIAKNFGIRVINC